MADRKKGGTSPYAAGGGGVTLERTYGATLLSAVLAGDPVQGLGDDMRPVRVQTQSGPDSPVDDYVIEGENALAGTSRRLSVGVRRDPTIAPSDAKFIKLLGDYVRIAIEHAAEIDDDRWRLALAVADPHTGASETKILTDFARSQLTNDSFRETVGRDGVTTADVRARLRYFDDAVVAALAATGLTTKASDASVLTWRLLRALRILLLRLEGDDATDRTHAIGRLRSVVGEPAEADTVFSTLCERLAKWAPRAAAIDETFIRRELRGVAKLNGSTSHANAWSVLERCEKQLKTRTSSTLTEASTGTLLTLTRQDQLQSLAAEMRAVGESSGSLLVTGHPEVGKSALTVAAVDLLRSEGAAIIALSLRDLPQALLELERLLDATLDVVLGGTPVANSRLIVVDGAEAVLEGKGDLLTHIARSAAAVGLGIVAVAREDAGPAATRAITVPAGPKVEQFAVPGLIDQEVAQVLAQFPALARVGGDPRSRWLVTRLGLVEVLLQSGAHAALPNGALSEADVFAAVWAHHVRKNEVVVAGAATPDGREAALVTLAHKSFDPQATPSIQDPLALPSLRSDRLLLPLGETAAWRVGDDFANDVVRDFATARLLITSPTNNLLAQANAPRWSLRAARLACQTALIQAGVNTNDALAAARSSFDSLASTHGERWADVPWEAVITLGSARAVLLRAAPTLLERRGAGLAQLLRVVRQRFARGSIIPEPVFIEPIIELLCDHRRAIAKLPREIGQEAGKIIAAWLASLAVRGKQDATHPLRCRVRDELLAGTQTRRNEHLVNCLGLLGPDLDGPSEKVLRDIARDAPDDLHPCLEQSFGPISLAAHRLDLLLALTEAYYIEQPDLNDRSGWHRYRMHDQGLRRHHGVGGFASPMASPFYGPFWVLLLASFQPTIALINRILNHAARYRVARNDDHPTGIPLEQLLGINVDIPGMGQRRFVGDDHVWRWYRGNGVGPYPCMSALLAIERFLDQLLVAIGAEETGKILSKVVPVLLRGCENLAIPGLIVGTLVRYVHGAPLELLEPWLQNPEVWHLEFGRTIQEHAGFRAHGRDPESQPWRDRRSWSFRDVSYLLVSRALLADDRQRLASLDAIGDALNKHAAQQYARARAAAEGNPDSEFDEAEETRFITTVRGWASSLQQAHFRVESKEGALAVEYEPPAEVVEAFASDRRDHERGQKAWHLQHLYTTGDPSTWNATLRADIANARELEAQPPNSGPPDIMDPVVAVAAGALQCIAAGVAELPADDVAWAVDSVIAVASRLGGNELGEDRIMLPWGADRSSARSIPLVLTLPENTVDNERRQQAAEAACSLASSPAEEVRRILAVAMRPFWAAPCHCVGEGCLHKVVFQGFRQAARMAKMSSGFDPTTGKRSMERLGDDVESALKELAAQDMLTDWLVGPLVVAVACSASTCCTRDPALKLRDALVDAHGRGSVHYAEQNFHGTDDNDRLVAEVLLEGDQDLLLQHVRIAVSHARALEKLLRNLAMAATADLSHRQAFSAAWPLVMDAVLDAIAEGRDVREERYGGAGAFASAIPRPIPTGQEDDIDDVLQRAAEGWPTVAALEQRIERWLPLAEGSPEAADSLVSFLDTAPLPEQIRRLPWVSRIVSADFDEIANRCHFLILWLESLRASGLLDPSTLGEYQRLVDGLAAAGDSRALRLQLALEQ